MSITPKSAYRRILLKLSGEALMGAEGFGIDPKVLDRMAQEIKELVELGVQVGLVIGGGNLFRGEGLAKAGMNRVVGDHMGMLASPVILSSTNDPVKNPEATLYEELTYQEVLEKELKVMDLSAFTLARDHSLPIRVFNMNKPGCLKRVVMGEKEGTVIRHADND